MKNYVYLIYSQANNSYKIGISKNPIKRLKELQTGNSDKLEILSIFESLFANKLEKTLHRQFNHLHDRGEWFFLSEQEVSNFLNICEKTEETFIFLKNDGNYFFQ